MKIDTSLGFLTNWREGMQHAFRALQGRLTFTDNIQCVVTTVADTGAANTTFTVTHKLGRVPIAYIVNSGQATSIYDVTKASWTTTSMTLKSTTANASLTLVVF